MIKVTNLQEMNRIENGSLQMHIQEKAEAMMREYHVDNLDDIGGFVILEKEEFACVPMNELECWKLEQKAICMVSESLMKAMVRTSICPLRW